MDWLARGRVPTKAACELRARDPVPGRRSARAYGRPGGAARTKGRRLGASEADACAMLKEERAATLT